MKQKIERFGISPLALGSDRAEVKLTQMQADIVGTARMWAVDEIGAAMIHQLNEPLTALLLYLHGIEENNGSGEADSESTRQLLESAIRETERFGDIIRRMSRTLETKVEAEVGIARGREAFNSWTRNSAVENIRSGVSVHSSHPLTPRERQVLNLIIEGVSNKEGGHQLQISTRTFEVHRAHIMGKLGARNAADLVRMALSEVL